MQLDLEEVTELLGNNEMFLVLMQIHIFAVLPQWNAMPAVRLLEARKANTRDVIGFRGKEPLQRFREPVCEQLDRGGGHLFTALTFESLFQIVLTGERAVLIILLFDHLKHPIIDMARRSQASHEQVGLFLIHVQSVLKCFHVLCYNALEKVCQQVRPPAGGRQCTHLLESSGPLAAFLVESWERPSMSRGKSRKGRSKVRVGEAASRVVVQVYHTAQGQDERAEASGPRPGTPWPRHGLDSVWACASN